MSTVGMFGKMPSFGDFVSLGSGSPQHRGFERWLEASNDVLAERGHELSKNPLGLLIRGEDRAELLVGILVGSSDSVGRSFPLGLFFEVSSAKAALAGLPLAMAADLGRLAGVARKARSRGHHEVQELVRALPQPRHEELAVRSQAELHRLRIVKATLMLERVFGGGHGPHYGCQVIGHATALASERRGRTPLVLEGRARTDVELMFSLATIEAVSGGVQPGAVLWEVRNHRVLFVLGLPDPGLLALMAAGGDAERVWPLWTDQAVLAQRAREELPAAQRDLLDEPGAISAKDFLAALAVACKPTHPQASATKERRRPWRRRAQ